MRLPLLMAQRKAVPNTRLVRQAHHLLLMIL